MYKKQVLGFSRYDAGKCYWSLKYKLVLAYEPK